MDGKSVIPLMKGIEKKPRTAFIEAGNPGKTGEPPKQPNVRAIRTDKWKYIRNYFDETEELYDLESDSTESNNLIKTETFVASELRQALNKELNSYYKGIIIAAGKSERLRPLTDHIPKCLLEVDGKPMLEHTLDNFKWNNIKNLSVIRGYKKEKINYPGHKYYDDNIQNGILSSLMHAKDEMHGPFVAVYSDIMFEKEILSELLETKGDIVISTDVDWKKNYHDRSDHPLDEAEKVIFEDDKVKDIGKHILSSHANGEFVGLVKFSARGAKVLREIYEKSKRTYRYTPFQKAPEFEKAYLTDIIKEMVDQGFEVRISKIKNRWVEFDTVQDYQKVQNGPGVLK
jgi:L-glutamine-phosphate cytidylyltransferase